MSPDLTQDSEKEFGSGKIWHVVFGSAVSLAILVWLALGFDWQQVLAGFRAVRIAYLPPLFIVLFFHHYLRALRWKIFLGADPAFERAPFFGTLMIGNFCNFLLPLRLGEIARPYVLSQETGTPFSRIFSSVFLERIFDLLFIVISFSVLGGFFDDLPGWIGRAVDAAYRIAGLGALGLVALLLLAVLLPERKWDAWLRPLQRLPAFLAERLDRVIRETLRSLHVLARVRAMLLISFYTAAIWMILFLYFQIGLGMFGLEEIEWHMGATIAVLIALAALAPSAPGFVGLFQAACVAAFALYGQSAETAISYAILTHLIQYVLIVVFGIYYLNRLRKSYEQFSRAYGFFRK